MTRGTVDEIDLVGEDEKVRQVELFISNLLRIGVITSVAIIFVGMVMTFVHHPEYRTSHEALDGLLNHKMNAETGGDGAFPTSPREVVQGLGALQGRAVVVLGVLLLVATPVMRVAASVLAFVYEKDRRFVIITLVVLGFLIVSFFLGKVE